MTLQLDTETEQHSEADGAQQGDEFVIAHRLFHYPKRISIVMDRGE